MQGVIYYTQLVDMERPLDGRADTQPVFPAGMDVERRMRFLAAHVSLSALSVQLHTGAPPLPPSGCPSHSLCLRAWEELWVRAAEESDASSFGSADILGKLRAMMASLKRKVSEAPTMSIDCSLAALEAAVTLRDDIINGLMDHFA